MYLTKIAIMLAKLGVSGIYFDALLIREERTIKRDSKIDLEVSIQQQVGETCTCSIHRLTNTYRIINSASFISFSRETYSFRFSYIISFRILCKTVPRQS